MSRGVVGGVVLPAAPDDVGPAAGEDAFCVGVGFAAGAQFSVAVGGPLVASPAVAGEVADRFPEFGVTGPSEGDDPMSAAGSGGWRHASEAAQRFGVWESGSAVADLGQQGCGAHGRAAWQRSEDVGVRMGVEELVEAGVELVDLGSQRFEHVDVGEGDRSAGVAFVAVDPGGCGDQPVVELSGGLAAAVAVGPHPCVESLLGQPVRSGCGREPLEEPQRDRAVDVAEQSDGAGEHDSQVGAELVRDRDASLDEVLASTHMSADRDRCRRVRLQRSPAVPVSAQAVGEYVGVGSVGLVARRSVTFTQGFDRARRHDNHLQPGLKQLIDHRAVGSLDRHPERTRVLDPSTHLDEPVGAVSDIELGHRRAAFVDHAHRVTVHGPIHAGVTNDGIIHLSLLAVTAVRKHPVVQDVSAGRSLIGALGRSALLPVDTPWTAGPRRTHAGGQTASDRGDDPTGTRECIDSFTATDRKMVHQ